MKNLVTLFLLAFAFTFTGCGGADSTPAAPDEYADSPMADQGLDLEGGDRSAAKKAKDAAKEKVGSVEGGMR